MATKRGRPKKSEHTISQEEILSTAFAILDRQGEAGLSMRAIARQLDINPMTIYHHIGTRNELLIAMVEEVYGDLALPPPQNSSKESVKSLLLFYLNTVLEHPNLALCILSNPQLAEIGDKELTNQILDRLRQYDIAKMDLEVYLDVLIDYTHGFAFAAVHKATLENADKKISVYRLTENAYLKGLDLILK